MAIRRQHLYFISGVAVLAAVLPLYYFHDPHLGQFPACPFYRLTGWFCTGCGSQRAIHDLLHLNPLESMGHNLLLLPALALVFWQGVRVSGLARNIKSPLAAVKAPRYILLVIVVFTVLRNLPWQPFEVLAP